MDRAWIAEQCLALPDAYCDQPFGPEAWCYRVHGRIFALVSRWPVVAPGWILNLKAEVEEVPRLVRTHAWIHPGYHMNKRHWISVSFAPGTDLELVASLVEDSYDNVVAGLPAALRPAGSDLPR